MERSSYDSIPNTGMEFLYGECYSPDDAVDFIQFKLYDNWHVLFHPFKSPMTGLWDFGLYRFVKDID